MNRLYKSLFGVLAVILIAACGTTAPEQQSAPTQDLNAAFTAVAQTMSASNSATTETPLPPPTSQPPAAPAGAGEYYAWNYVAAQESGGVKVEIVRVVVSDKSAVTNQNFAAISAFDDRPVVAEFVFRITNSTANTVSLYPDQGTVIAGSEQIELAEFMIFGTFGDSLGGDIYPGVIKIGGIWFGFKRTPVSDIQQMTVAFSAPHDENFNTLGPDFKFTLDLSQRKDEPLPDEFK